jgi:centromere protein I
MLPEWNGSFGRETILGLLSLLPLGPFEGWHLAYCVVDLPLLTFTELHSQIFLLIEDALLDANTIECKLALLKFYANLLNSWTVSLRSTPQLSQAAAPAITDLVNHANCLATVIIQDSPDLAAISRVLNFYEVIGTLISQPSILEKIRIPVPPSELIYIFHFSNSLDILNRLCGLLSLYKTAFETGRALNPKQYSQDYVNHFNGFLMDVCNCVWRSRAFNTTDPNALGCLLYEKSTAQLEEYVKSFGTSITLPSLFSLSFSPVLCVLSISYVRELEDAAENMIKVRHPGPVTQTSLKQLERDGGLSLSWQDYRLGVLMELEQKGIKGIGELMYNTMKALKTERENRA